jgi:4-amino-4-deoxy-L-arabinose transferase-like glycosyltransferase
MMATIAGPVPSTAAARWGGTNLTWPILIGLLAVAAVAIGWTGFIASDDEFYYQGALRWAEAGPFAGDSHWTTRFPLVLSLAAAIRLLGASETAMIATSLFWYAAYVTTGTLLAQRLAGTGAAAFTALLLATMPVVATSASIVNCDLPETTFLMLGALLLIGAGERASLTRCLGAGVAFGLAMLCRETAVLALAGLGALFVAGRPLPRSALFMAGCGAALVLLGEAAFQWAMTGDPFHRYGLAFNHDSHLDRAANEEGNLLIHPAIDPLLVLFVNNEFALLFWLAIPAGLALRRGGFDWRRFAIFGAMAAASFLLIALLSHKLVLNPRYFMPTASAAAILAGAWLARLNARRAGIILAVAVAANLAMLSLQNGHPHWDAEALVQAAAADPGRTVTSNPDIVRRAQQRLQWAGLTNVRSDGPYQLVPSSEAGEAEAFAAFPAPWRPAGKVAALLGMDIARLKAGRDMVLIRR